MARVKGWIHGSRFYREVVIEVQEQLMVRRGFKPSSLGWMARLSLGPVEVITVKPYPTDREAEDAVVEACEKLFNEERIPGA